MVADQQVFTSSELRDTRAHLLALQKSYDEQCQLLDSVKTKLALSQDEKHLLSLQVDKLLASQNLEDALRNHDAGQYSVNLQLQWLQEELKLTEKKLLEDKAKSEEAFRKRIRELEQELSRQRAISKDSDETWKEHNRALQKRIEMLETQLERNRSSKNASPNQAVAAVARQKTAALLMEELEFLKMAHLKASAERDEARECEESWRQLLSQKDEELAKCSMTLQLRDQELKAITRELERARTAVEGETRLKIICERERNDLVTTLAELEMHFKEEQRRLLADLEYCKASLVSETSRLEEELQLEKESKFVRERQNEQYRLSLEETQAQLREMVLEETTSMVLRKERDELKTKNQQLQISLENALNSITDCDQINTNLKSENKQFRADLEELRSHLMESEEGEAAAYRENMMLQDQLDEANRKTEEKELELDVQHQRIIALESQLQATLEQSAVRKQHLEEERTARENQRESLQSAISMGQLAVDDAENSRKVISILQDHLTQSRSDLEHLRMGCVESLSSVASSLRSGMLRLKAKQTVQADAGTEMELSSSEVGTQITDDHRTNSCVESLARGMRFRHHLRLFWSWARWSLQKKSKRDRVRMFVEQEKLNSSVHQCVDTILDHGQKMQHHTSQERKKTMSYVHKMMASCTASWVCSMYFSAWARNVSKISKERLHEQFKQRERTLNRLKSSRDNLLRQRFVLLSRSNPLYRFFGAWAIAVNQAKSATANHRGKKAAVAVATDSLANILEKRWDYTLKSHTMESWKSEIQTRRSLHVALHTPRGLPTQDMETILVRNVLRMSKIRNIAVEVIFLLKDKLKVNKVFHLWKLECEISRMQSQFRSKLLEYSEKEQHWVQLHQKLSQENEIRWQQRLKQENEDREAQREQLQQKLKEEIEEREIQWLQLKQEQQEKEVQWTQLQQRMKQENEDAEIQWIQLQQRWKHDFAEKEARLIQGHKEEMENLIKTHQEKEENLIKTHQEKEENLIQEYTKREVAMTRELAESEHQLTIQAQKKLLDLEKEISDKVATMHQFSQLQQQARKGWAKKIAFNSGRMHARTAPSECFFHWKLVTLVAQVEYRTAALRDVETMNSLLTQQLLKCRQNAKDRTCSQLDRNRTKLVLLHHFKMWCQVAVTTGRQRKVIQLALDLAKRREGEIAQSSAFDYWREAVGSLKQKKKDHLQQRAGVRDLWSRHVYHIRSRRSVEVGVFHEWKRVTDLAHHTRNLSFVVNEAKEETSVQVHERSSVQRREWARAVRSKVSVLAFGLRRRIVQRQTVQCWKCNVDLQVQAKSAGAEMENLRQDAAELMKEADDALQAQKQCHIGRAARYSEVRRDKVIALQTLLAWKLALLEENLVDTHAVRATAESMMQQKRLSSADNRSKMVNQLAKLKDRMSMLVILTEWKHVVDRNVRNRLEEREAHSKNISTHQTESLVKEAASAQELAADTLSTMLRGRELNRLEKEKIWSVAAENMRRRRDLLEKLVHFECWASVIGNKQDRDNENEKIRMTLALARCRETAANSQFDQRERTHRILNLAQCFLLWRVITLSRIAATSMASIASAKAWVELRKGLQKSRNSKVILWSVYSRMTKQLVLIVWILQCRQRSPKIVLPSNKLAEYRSHVVEDWSNVRSKLGLHRIFVLWCSVSHRRGKQLQRICALLGRKKVLFHNMQEWKTVAVQHKISQQHPSTKTPPLSSTKLMEERLFSEARKRLFASSQNSLSPADQQKVRGSTTSLGINGHPVVAFQTKRISHE